MKALLLGLALLAGPAAADEAKGLAPGPVQRLQPGDLYTERVTSRSALRARDGVRLAMDVHRPAVNGKPVEQDFPVVWQTRWRAACDGPVLRRRRCPALTIFGYVVVEVDRRGAGASFGSLRRGYNDAPEARDA